MAVSPMQKITLVTSKALLPELLTVLQEDGQVHLNNLKVLDDWQDLEASERGTSKREEEAEAVNLLPQLQKRQEKVQKALTLYQQHLPKKGLVASLTEELPELTFQELEAQGRQFNEQLAVNRASQLNKRLKDLEKEAQTLQADLALLTQWQKLDVLPQGGQDHQVVNVAIGTVPADSIDRYYKALAALPDLVVKRVFSNPQEVGVVVFSQKLSSQADFLDSLAPASFQALDYPFDRLPQEQLPLTSERLKTVQETIQAIRQELTQSQETVDQLKIQLDYLANHNLRETASQNAGLTEHLAAVEGWTETRATAHLQETLKQAFNGLVVMKVADAKDEELDQVPIKLRNHPLVAPFESVTRMYALPKYNEVDPTPYLAPFYWTFFGMMVADLGYGLLVMLATAIGLWLIKGRESLRTTCKFYFSLGLSTAIWGAIYGSAFGFNLPFKLIDTNTDVTTILLISVGLGFLQIMTGLFLNTYQKAKRRDFHEAYANGLAWIFILLGLVAMVLGPMIPGAAWLGTVGQILATVNAIGIVLSSVIKAKSLGGLGSGLYNLYGISGYIGDFVSYTRLMALGLSGGSIGAAFNTIVAFLPVWARFSIGLLLFVLLHGLNIFLSMLSGYVHGARLMFVEFFGKFYEGGGQPFQPLAPVNQNVQTKVKSEE